MSKATWDEEVEFEDTNPEELPASGMELNPQALPEDKLKYETSASEDEEPKEEESKENTDSGAIDEIKYKLSQYDKLRRQNFAQSQQMRSLMAERNEFQQKLAAQYETNLNFVKENLDSRLAITKAKLGVAIEAGNTDEIAEINTEIATIAAEIRDISREREEWDFSKKRNEEENQQYQEHIKVSNNKNLNWFYSNPEFNPQNPKYDKHLQREFINYAKEIDNELSQQGKSHVIGTPEYYDYFENVMDIYRREKGGETAPLKKQANNFNPVAPVSRGSTGSSSVRGKSKNSVYITPEEARINKLWGITPEEHVKFTREWKDKDFEMEY